MMQSGKENGKRARIKEKSKGRKYNFIIV